MGVSSGTQCWDIGSVHCGSCGSAAQLVWDMGRLKSELKPGPLFHVLW